jgi:dihydrofolate synthase/folylpolyglutamate synthase
MTVSDSLSALEFLTRRINYERTTTVPYQTSEFKLDRMRRLLSCLDDPHLAVKAVHIAGTKGKGSTAVMAASILQAAGYRTGLYTSPHLERIEERIVIDGQMCPPDVFLRLVERVQPAVEQLDREAEAQGASGPTFFEVTTAIAFLHFAEARVDAAVLEVGLGGRLDSTNVCRPEVCIITTISFDHTKQLGSTLAAIAGEKAGIIKPGVPVVSGVLDPEPRQVITARAEEIGAPIFERSVAYDFAVPLTTHHAPLTETFDYREPAASPTYELKGLRLNLLGRHQCANAAAAICAIKRLVERGWSIGDKHIRAGLAATHCPARVERVMASPAVILDVAHNVASIEAVIATLAERFTSGRRIAIFASSKDKDYRGMLRQVLEAFDTVILTQYVHNPRAQTTEELLAAALELRAASVTGNGPRRPVVHAAVRPTEAWRLARHVAQPNDLICITGSFFLAAEMRGIIPRS